MDLASNSRGITFDLDAAVDELRRDGITILRGALGRGLIERWAEAFGELFERRQRIPGGLAERGPGRYYTTLPWVAPFADPAVFAHPDVIAIVDRILQSDFAMVQLAADTPVLGSERQELHRDHLPLFDEGFFTPIHGLAVNIPLVDVTEENGPFAMARGTHALPRMEADLLVEEGHIPVETFPMAAGDVMIRSPFALHCGTPNRTPQPRPMVVVGFVRKWLATPELRMRILRRDYEALDPMVRTMLRCEVVDRLEESAEIYDRFAF